MFNLAVELHERFDAAAASQARERIARAGYTLEEMHGASDRTLAWIDDAFGGGWSSEANVASNAIASIAGAPAAFASYDSPQRRYAWLRGIATDDGAAVFGPFGVDPAHRRRGLGASLLVIALGAMRARGARQAIIAAVGESLVPFYERACGARIAERFDLASFTPRPVRTVVLASGYGSNFQAVLDRVATGTLPLEIAAFVTNKENAHAIERARAAAVERIHVLPWRRTETSRADYDRSLLEAVSGERPELVLLLGWMHVLDGTFVRAFPELINVHPAFLPLDSSRETVGMPDGTAIPAFRGAHAVRDAIGAGCKWTGVSVHGVVEEADRGPVFVRKPVRIAPQDTIETLAARLHPLEHDLLERGIKRWLYER